ncbi:hypothetical protein Lal_00026905 [Lupinus albus]|nr:hypothetical protein Lal_00026905 [Lupinus albus]
MTTFVVNHKHNIFKTQYIFREPIETKYELFFTQAGFPCPPLRNPIDHFLNLGNGSFIATIFLLHYYYSSTNFLKVHVTGCDTTSKLHHMM